MVSVLASSAVDRGFEPRLGPTEDYTIGICCFSANQTAVMSNIVNTGWLEIGISVRMEGNVYLRTCFSELAL
jgi:hypothetical protein